MNYLYVLRSLFFLICASIACNISAFSLKIDTSKIYHDAKPGKVLEGSINIVNESKTDLSLIAEIEDLNYEADKQQVSFAPFATLPDSCSRWLRLIPNYPVVPAESSFALKYIINVPEAEKLESAEYYSIIFISSRVIATQADRTMDVGSRSRIGILVKIRITEKAKPEGKLVSYKVTFLENSEHTLSLKYKFENTGNVLQKVIGQYSIIDENGSLFGRGMLKGGTSKPGDVIEIEDFWDGELDAGTYDVITEFRYAPDQVEIMEQQIEAVYED